MSKRAKGPVCGLTLRQVAVKRTFDFVVAGSLLVVLAPLITVVVIAATLDTRNCGIFRQRRIGRGGVAFYVYKIRTMAASSAVTTTVTTSSDPRITRLGAILRRYKLDELPQLWNVVIGNMSIVGPRPDVPGWADKLEGPDRIVLSVRPGITGVASLAFRSEEQILADAEDPEAHNRDIIWPEKVRLNRQYIESWCFKRDIEIILRTAIG